MSRARGKTTKKKQPGKLRLAIAEYSRANGYVAEHFADAVCACGARQFMVRLDDAAGVAIRTCTSCGQEHPIGDSGDYLDEAELDEAACPCGNEQFEVTVGVSLYAGGEDVRWLYLGCSCPNCGLAAVYGDWKNEFEDYQELLRRV